jgi:hypothetical protein
MSVPEREDKVRKEMIQYNSGNLKFGEKQQSSNSRNQVFPNQINTKLSRMRGI